MGFSSSLSVYSDYYGVCAVVCHRHRDREAKTPDLSCVCAYMIVAHRADHCRPIDAVVRCLCLAVTLWLFLDIPIYLHMCIFENVCTSCT